jgi:hypothetical protein
MCDARLSWDSAVKTRDLQRQAVVVRRRRRWGIKSPISWLSGLKILHRGGHDSVSCSKLVRLDRKTYLPVAPSLSQMLPVSSSGSPASSASRSRSLGEMSCCDSSSDSVPMSSPL